jgi:hypothetical protein
MTKGLERLQRRLSNVDANFKRMPRPRGDDVKRCAALSVLDAFREFAQAQPGYRVEQLTHLTRLADALRDVENGRRVSWLEPSKGRNATPIRTQRRRGKFVGTMEVLTRSHVGGRPLSPTEAAETMLDDTPLRVIKPLLAKSARPSVRSLLNLRDSVKSSPGDSPQYRAFAAVLAKAKKAGLLNS